MADEKPTPRKRAPRKKPAAAAPDADAVVEAEASSDAEDSTEGAGREVVTTTSSVVKTTSAEPGAEAAEVPEPEVTRRDLNRTVLGELTVHTSTRDVVVMLDGESAARVMAVFGGTLRRRGTQDLMHPAASEMRHLWLSVDLSDVIALSWMPGLPTGGEHVMTVDPPVPEDIAR